MFGMWLIFGYYIYLEVPQKTIAFIWFCFWVILHFDIWCSKMLSKGCLCCACRFCLAGLQHLLLAGGIYRHLIFWVFYKLKLPLLRTISGGAKPLPQCQVVPESRHRGPGWVCEVNKDDLSPCEAAKVLSRKIFRSLYLYFWCLCQWKYARSKNKHARPQNKIRVFFHHTFIPNTSNYILFRTNCAIHWPLSYCARRWIGHNYKTKKEGKNTP